MQYRIRIRHRAPQPKPWKWEIMLGDRLVTASHNSYASQEEAYSFAEAVLERLARQAAQKPISYDVEQGRMLPTPDK